MASTYHCRSSSSCAHLKERFFTSIDAVVPITHALEEYDIETYGISTDDCLVAPDGVDIEPYERQTRSGARDELGLPEDERIVMYTGHLHSGKGVETPVEAAAEITAQVYVVGGYEDDIERVCSERNVPDNVVFTGSVQPSEISIYQNASDILVAPYTTESRDFISPLKLFEYMATGNPVVATSRPILQEVLTHGENALLAEPNDPKDLARHVDELLTDKKRARAIADRTRADV